MAVRDAPAVWPYGGRVRRGLLLGIVLLLAAAGCTQASNAKGGTSATRPSHSAKPSPKRTHHHARPTPTRRRGHHPLLPTSCNALISINDLRHAVGKLTGRTVYIRGIPEAKIKRTGRTTCSYGVRGKTIPLEVAVSGYQTTGAALARVQITVASFRDSGAAISTVRVGGKPATVGVGHDGATLVMAIRYRTVAISIIPKLERGHARQELTALARAVVANLP